MLRSWRPPKGILATDTSKGWVKPCVATPVSGGAVLHAHYCNDPFPNQTVEVRKVNDHRPFPSSRPTWPLIVAVDANKPSSSHIYFIRCSQPSLRREVLPLLFKKGWKCKKVKWHSQGHQYGGRAWTQTRHEYQQSPYPLLHFSSFQKSKFSAS